MSADWVEIQVELPADAAELVAAALSESLGGVELRDAETLFSTTAGRTAVVALCQPDQRDDVLALVDEVLGTARIAGAEVDPVAVRERQAHEDEWRDVWKQFFRTTRIGRHFVVRPSWEPPTAPEAGTHVIDLDPGRAFGTGAHPSTRLVIAALEDLADAGAAPARVLDLGCGSGILAIAAARLWPRATGLAVDNDPEATACTDENFARNQVASVTTQTGTLDDVSGRFDLVMANIQRDVLEAIAPALVKTLAPKGHLVLSGLLTTDADPVAAAYVRAGLEVRGRRDEGEWASLVLGSPST